MRPRNPSTRAGRLAGLLLPALLFLPGCEESTSPEGEPEQVVSIAVVTPPPDMADRNVTFEVQPVVELRSAAGARIRRAGVEIQATVSPGTLGGTTSVMTDAEGRATFTDLAVDGQGGLVTLRFSCCEAAPAEHPLVVHLGAAGIVLGAISPQRVEARAGTELTPGPSVNLTSEFFMPVEGAVVRFALEGPGTIPVDSVVSDAQGVAELPSFTLHDRPGTSLLHARLESGQNITFVLKATAEGEVELLDGGEALIGEPGGEFIVPPIRVTYGGVPQSNVRVSFLRSGGSDGPASVSAVTDANGMTPPVALPLSPEQGINVYEAWAIGYSATPLVLEIVGSPGAPFSLVSREPADVSALEGSNGRTFVGVRMMNSAGEPVMDAPVRFSELGEAGVVEWWDMFGPAGVGTYPTDELGWVMVSWRVPSNPGTYRIQVESPYAAVPLIFTAVREE